MHGHVQSRATLWPWSCMRRVGGGLGVWCRTGLSVCAHCAAMCVNITDHSLEFTLPTSPTGISHSHGQASRFSSFNRLSVKHH